MNEAHTSRARGQIAEVDIESLGASGDGLANVGGRRVSVPFTIPGERVRVHLVERRGREAAATLLEVLRPSPHRITPTCRHFGPGAEPGLGPCGGCTWQHIDYREQLRLKTQMVHERVRVAVPDAPATKPMLTGTAIDNPWGYRNKVHFVFGSRGSKLTMGHYARGSRTVIPVEECPVHHPRGNAFAFAARETFVAADLDAADAGHGTLRSLAVRVGQHTSEVMAALIVSSDRDRRVRSATRRLLGRTPPTSMHLNVHARDDAFIFGPSTRHLHGPGRMREVAAGTSFLISPAAFFQTNVSAAEILVRVVLEAVKPVQTVLDLYAGSGLFAIPLAAAGNTVVAVEENRIAVADGEAALKLNREAQPRCRFLPGRVETRIRSFREADVVVLDPPREGCSPSVLRDVFRRVRPATAVYISCNPEALASDLRAIAATGYRVTDVQPVDMFPHTAHIETVVRLARRKTA